MAPLSGVCGDRHLASPRAPMLGLLLLLHWGPCGHLVPPPRLELVVSAAFLRCSGLEAGREPCPAAGDVVAPWGPLTHGAVTLSHTPVVTEMSGSMSEDGYFCPGPPATC